MSFDKKEARKVFRKLAKNNKHLTRYQYLAYAFLRGTEYIKIEAKINEDKFPEIGRNTFLLGLAITVFHEIHRSGKYEGYDETFQEYLKNDILRNEVKSWIYSKYASDKKEAA